MTQNLSARMIDIIVDIASRSTNISGDVLCHIKGKNISRPERLEIIDLVSDELMSKGFREDLEPNAYGLELEGIIDILNDYDNYVGRGA